MSTKTLKNRIDKLKSNINSGIDIEQIIKRRMYYLKRGEPVPPIGTDSFKISSQAIKKESGNDVDEIQQRIIKRMKKLDNLEIN